MFGAGLLAPPGRTVELNVVINHHHHRNFHISSYIQEIKMRMECILNHFYSERLLQHCCPLVQCKILDFENRWPLFLYVNLSFIWAGWVPQGSPVEYVEGPQSTWKTECSAKHLKFKVDFACGKTIEMTTEGVLSTQVEFPGYENWPGQ